MGGREGATHQLQDRLARISLDAALIHSRRRAHGAGHVYHKNLHARGALRGGRGARHSGQRLSRLN